MAHYNSFEELEIFKKARVLANNVWKLIQTSNLKQDFELINQIKVLGIVLEICPTSNIATKIYKN